MRKELYKKNIPIFCVWRHQNFRFWRTAVSPCSREIVLTKRWQENYKRVAMTVYRSFRGIWTWAMTEVASILTTLVISIIICFNLAKIWHFPHEAPSLLTPSLGSRGLLIKRGTGAQIFQLLLINTLVTMKPLTILQYTNIWVFNI